MVQSQRVEHDTNLIEPPFEVDRKTLVRVDGVITAYGPCCGRPDDGRIFGKPHLRTFVDGKGVQVVGVKGELTVEGIIIGRMEIVVGNVLCHNLIRRLYRYEIPFCVQIVRFGIKIGKLLLQLQIIATNLDDYVIKNT